MPAIRYLYNGSSPWAGAMPDTIHLPVQVQIRGGDVIRVCWRGFICMAGTAHMAGKLVKVLAISVTDGDGGHRSEWRDVAKDERVLGWAIPHKGATSGHSVYGIVDAHGWPIVIKDKLPPGPKPTAEVMAFGKREPKKTTTTKAEG